jgi:hypothetical protein
MNLGWAIAGWIGAGVVWGGTLIWSSRYRRDRDRPTGGLPFERHCPCYEEPPMIIEG